MVYQIKRGRHRAWPPRLGLFIKPKAFRRAVVFHENCRYEIEGEDMADLNKLFGVGFFPGLHHRDSARIGWRYEAGQILLAAYCYVEGRRVIKEICRVDLFARVLCFIYIYQDCYVFRIIANGETYTESVGKFHKKAIAYPLGLYFGGNKTAPQTMSVEIKKL